jgi:hypothetical protein
MATQRRRDLPEQKKEIICSKPYSVVIYAFITMQKDDSCETQAVPTVPRTKRQQINVLFAKNTLILHNSRFTRKSRIFFLKRKSFSSRTIITSGAAKLCIYPKQPCCASVELPAFRNSCRLFSFLAAQSATHHGPRLGFKTIECFLSASFEMLAPRCRVLNNCFFRAISFDCGVVFFICFGLYRDLTLSELSHD